MGFVSRLRLALKSSPFGRVAALNPSPGLAFVSHEASPSHLPYDESDPRRGLGVRVSVAQAARDLNVHEKVLSILGEEFAVKPVQKLPSENRRHACVAHGPIPLSVGQRPWQRHLGSTSKSRGG
ncbi:hypothetical protein CHELA1G11_20623 [Hyphomicrobiales bacterium]|nr:hypothetical protein CHELA1G11_20623 [Hyphomicrobiales bacterium]CAH1691108.1 hypothetical protein CHELA1G2_20937 [Hyphomicrobiales bacterium]